MERSQDQVVLWRGKKGKQVLGDGQAMGEGGQVTLGNFNGKAVVISKVGKRRSKVHDVAEWIMRDSSY